MNRRHQALILFAVLGGVLLSAGCISSLHGLFPAASYPEIRTRPEAASQEAPEYRFRFEDFQVTLSSPVDPEVYAGARSAEKEVKIYDTTIDDEEWRSGLYRTMTMDPAQDPFFDDLANEFRSIRAGYDLDSDEYLELMAAFVQSIPYRNQNLSSPKYPIETFTDMEGDCDDKSMLLAGLLAHEGYGTALLYFGPEQHMAVGVACEGGGYHETGYAYIETTRVSLVGAGIGSVAGNITIESAPLVIPIGKGVIRYGRWNESEAIYAELGRVKARLETMRTDLASRRDSLQSGRADLEAMDLAMEQMLAGGDYSHYNQMVVLYNGQVRDYNRDLEQFNTIAGEYTRLAERYNYILAHEYDREGTYRTLFGEAS